MKERPILFNGDMVRAILDGRKKQTRRPVSPQSAILTDEMARNLGVRPPHIENFPVIKCPFGQVGDRLWVRETWAEWQPGSPVFKADGSDITGHKSDQLVSSWRPSVHMPRWASRITLEITGIRVERVQDISEDDARAEGVAPAWLDVRGDRVNANSSPTFRQGFARTWNEIYAQRGLGWDANPWVWVVEFKRADNA